MAEISCKRPTILGVTDRGTDLILDCVSHHVFDSGEERRTSHRFVPADDGYKFRLAEH